MDPNFDIVPTLRMFDGVMTGKAADEIERLRAEVARLSFANPSVKQEAVASGSKLLPPRMTPEMKRAFVEAAREYAERTGGNDPDAMYEAAFRAVPRPTASDKQDAVTQALSIVADEVQSGGTAKSCYDAICALMVEDDAAPPATPSDKQEAVSIEALADELSTSYGHHLEDDDTEAGHWWTFDRAALAAFADRLATPLAQSAEQDTIKALKADIAENDALIDELREKLKSAEQDRIDAEREPWTYDQVVMLCETDGVPLPVEFIEWVAEKMTYAANIGSSK
ncbi:hypothetical protein AWB73_01995 [Caballeronia turbans]|nr:hypothetical protein AWB73_01995 [Caballeronia turbans]